MPAPVSENLIDRAVTPLRICPLTLTPQPPKLIEVAGPGPARPPEQEIRFCNCIGPACHLWQFEAGTDPRAGDCSFNISAQAASLTAHLMTRMFGSAAAQSNAQAPASTEPTQN